MISFWIGVSSKLNEVIFVSIETQCSINAYYTVDNINFFVLVSTEYTESESYIAWMSLNFQFSLSASKVLELCVCETTLTSLKSKLFHLIIPIAYKKIFIFVIK